MNDEHAFELNEFCVLYPYSYKDMQANRLIKFIGLKKSYNYTSYIMLPFSSGLQKVIL